MKIHIFYSHYNVSGNNGKARPEWFDYEKCFVNLLNTTKNKNTDIHLVMDGSIEQNWISKYKNYYTSHEIVGGGMENVTLGVYGTIHKLNIKDTDLIYILENDYLHVSNWVDTVFNLYQSFEGLSYVSLYDHNDKYFLPMYEDLTSKIFVSKDCHWRTTPSTCGSYITTGKIFKEDYLDHIGHTIPIGDHHKWLFLTETKNRFIITPIPGLSTHCMKGLESPTIDWSKI